MNKKILFVDIDNSLVNINTTFEFINMIVKNNLIKKIIFKFTKSFLFKILFKLQIFDSVVINYLLINKLDKNYLDDQAKILVSKLLKKKRFNKKCLKIIENKKKQKYEIVILSYSLDLIAKIIKEELNFDKYYSNTLLFNDNKCAGKLTKGFQKIDIINKYYNYNYEINFITDNIEDINCTLLTKKSYIVINEKNKKFWFKNKNINYEFIL